jgi:hypothetical protein
MADREGVGPLAELDLTPLDELREGISSTSSVCVSWGGFSCVNVVRLRR